MALTDCFIGTELLPGIISCVREGENMSCVVNVPLLLSGCVALLIAGALVDKIRSRRRVPEIKETRPLPSRFASQEQADAVWQYANTALYQYVLVELERALPAEGYILTRDPARRVSLTSTSQHRLAREMFLARERFLTPMRPESLMEEAADECSLNGFSAQWLSCLLRGCELQGWYVTQPEQATGTLSD